MDRNENQSSNPNQNGKMKPSRPDQFIGKTQATARMLFGLVPQLKADPCSHPLDRCFLFYGPPGTGKTSLAECLALTIAEGVHEIEQLNGQSTSVEIIREWMKVGIYAPMFGPIRVKLIDEIDAMSPAALNESRTWLDKLASRTVVIATTNRCDLQEQLESRFQRFKIDKVTNGEIWKWLQTDQGLSEDEAEQVTRVANGNVRAALAQAKALTNLRRMAA
jgi:replication-associated recombination protein RarA